MSWLTKKMMNGKNIKGQSPSGTVPKTLVVILSLLFFAQVCWATIGLETKPSQIDVTGVPLGKRVAVSKLTEQPVSLEIKNKSDVAYNYVITILHTAQTTYSLPTGYADIPDTSWIIPEEKEVMIKANQTKQVELCLNIPNKKAFAGGKYQAIIDVESKKNNPRDLFVLACQLRITLQTEKWNGGWLKGGLNE
jgi:hypothetical protein